jgi:hypothetical protein
MSKDLKEILFKLRKEHVATLAKVRVGMYVYSVPEFRWERVEQAAPGPNRPIVTEYRSYTKDGFWVPSVEVLPSIYLIDPINGTLPPHNINWHKVAIDTPKVNVISMYGHTIWKGILISYIPKLHPDARFVVLEEDCSERFKAHYCSKVELHKSVKIKPEWLQK